MSEVNSSNSGAVAATAESPATDNSQSDQSQGQSTKEPIAQTVAEKRKYKYKVDGKEFEEELSDDDVRQHLSMSKAANKRFQEAATIKKQSEQLIRMLRENPEAVLDNPQIMGNKKFREIAEAYLVKQLDEQMLTPEQRQQRDMEQKLRQYEQAEKQRKAQVEAEHMQKLEAHYMQDIESKIISGLNTQGIPKTPRTVKLMAELMSKNLQYGLDLEPQQLAEMVKQDYLADIQELFGATEADALLNLLGDNVSNKIRQADLKKLKASQPQFQRTSHNQSASSPNSSSSRQSEQKMSKDEWREFMDKKFGK